MAKNYAGLRSLMEKNFSALKAYTFRKSNFCRVKHSIVDMKQLGHNITSYNPSFTNIFNKFVIYANHDRNSINYSE